MKKMLLLCLVLLIASLGCWAQLKIGDNPNQISPGSLLELESTSKAFTLPRMTTAQMQAIPSPLSGMMIFNIDSNCIYLYRNNNAWSSITIATGSSANTTNASWPYHSNNQQNGPNGNGQGIISLTGVGLTASGNFSHAEGKEGVAYGDYSWSSGYKDTSSGTASVAMGYQNKASAAYAFGVGKNNIAAYQSSAVFGEENRDTGWSSMAAGIRNRIRQGVSYSHTFGYQNEIRGGSSGWISGESNVIGSGKANHALGFGHLLDGNYSVALGKSNQVLSGNSHLLTGDNNIVRNGNSNTLMGFNNVASGSFLTAAGRDNVVFSQTAIALGQSNKDSGFVSIAGGFNNTIHNNVQYSHVFGQNNLATRNLTLNGTTPGAGTFTAGIGNINSGYASIGLGAFNRSMHFYSLAGNFNTIANSYAMSAFGHFNDTITSTNNSQFGQNEILFAVGNGNGNSNRRNGLTMMRNGFTTINATNQNGPNIPRAELDVKGTGALIVPVGTTAERPATPVAGMIRICTDCPGGPVLQGFDGTSWVNL
jgi:hypothetical protein